MNLPCPSCGRLTHLGVCIHCGVTTQRQRPQDELSFDALDDNTYFRFPGSVVVYYKASDDLAEVLPELRAHPEAPRSGFLHPQRERLVHYVTHGEVALLRDPRSPDGLAGLIALELDAAGMLWFIFDTSDSRLLFLSFAAIRLDPAQSEVRTLRRDGCLFAAGIHPRQFRTPFVLPLSLK